jgi:hypothetical protein
VPSFYVGVSLHEQMGALFQAHQVAYTVWTVDFETPVCKLYLLFMSANAAQEKEKKRKKLLLPTGVSKSAAHWRYKVCSPYSNVFA